jgi:streptogramin lyase
MYFRFRLELVPVHPTKTSRGSGGSAPVILNSALDGDVWSASRTGRLIPGKGSTVFILYGAGWAPEAVRTFRKMKKFNA